nr:MAG TPA: hypothetical protein [Caudoviricetes sp.]
MAFVPFYLPKRIWKLFFRLGAYFFGKSFENSQGVFCFYKEEILLWLLFFCKFCPTTGKV